MLSWRPEGADGEPVDPGTVTVGIVRADSSELVADGSATVGSGSGERTYTLTVAETQYLDVLTASWSVDGVVVDQTEHEIVGGFYFTSADLREGEPSLSDPARDATDKLLAARTAVEAFLEGVCGCAFVPRLTRLAGFVEGDTVVLPPFPRAVRWARYRSGSGITYTPLTDDELATMGINDTGVITVPFPDNAYEIGVEHGATRPPADIRRAAMALARIEANRPRSGVSDRAVSMTTPDGGVMNFGRVGTKWRPTGIEWIDEILLRPDYNFRLAGTIL